MCAKCALNIVCYPLLSALRMEAGLSSGCSWLEVQETAVISGIWAGQPGRTYLGCRSWAAVDHAQSRNAMQDMRPVVSSGWFCFFHLGEGLFQHTSSLRLCDAVLWVKGTVIHPLNGCSKSTSNSLLFITGVLCIMPNFFNCGITRKLSGMKGVLCWSVSWIKLFSHTAVSLKVEIMFPEGAGWQNSKSLGPIFQERRTIFFLDANYRGCGRGGGVVVSQLLIVVNTKALDHISVLSYWFYG